MCIILLRAHHNGKVDFQTSNLLGIVLEEQCNSITGILADGGRLEAVGSYLLRQMIVLKSL